MIVKTVVLFFISSCLWAYEITPTEHLALRFIYGHYAASIEKDVQSSEFTHGRDGFYSPLDGKILVNSAREDRFKTSLMIVHEAMHWYQDKILHERLVFQTDEKQYTFDPAKADGFLGQEAEAELARILAIWFIQSIIPDYQPVVKPLFVIWDSLENRVRMWTHLSRFQHLAPPYNWDQGLSSRN